MRFRKLVLLFLLLSFGLISQAQGQPRVDSFTVDNYALDHASVEAGTASANFSWSVSGLRAGDTLVLYTFAANEWVPVAEGFEPVASGNIVISHPRDFAPPTYRLSVLAADGSIAAEQYLIFEYAAPVGVPSIRLLQTRLQSISPNALQAQEEIEVYWQVLNRWQNANIVFEQVFPDGTVVNIELPRNLNWLPAAGVGRVKPFYPGDGQDVVLRLRVINVDSNVTLDQYETRLPQIRRNAEPYTVRSFTLTPPITAQGGTTTLAWEVEGANRVFITQTTMGAGCVAGLAPEMIYTDLPASGTLDVQLPPETPFTAPIRFQLVPERILMESNGCGADNSLAERFLEAPSQAYPTPPLTSIGLTPSFGTVAGGTLTLNWAVSEGLSIAVTQGTGWSPDSSEPEQTITDLPLTGTLDIVVPNTAAVRQAGGAWVRVFLIRSADTAPELIWADTVAVDPDSNLSCNSYVETDSPIATNFLPGQTVNVTWDACGASGVVLETRLENYNSNYATIFEQSQDVASSGSQEITLPTDGGLVRFVLYTVVDGERVELYSKGLLIDLE